MLDYNSDESAGQSSDDLNWLACRYVLAELTDDEREAFELRLGHDQDAREAVAAAVELLEIAALAGAESRGASVPASGEFSSVGRPSLVESREATARRRPSIGSLLAISLAVGGLLACGVWGVNYAGRTSLPPSTGAAPDQALALVWSQTRQPELSEDALVEGTTAEAEPWLAEANDESGWVGDDVGSTERQGPTTPSWMTAAMRGLSDETEPSSDELDSATIREL